MYKLNIIEPWDFGTEHAIAVDLVAAAHDQYLLRLSEPRMFGNDSVNYLIGRLRNKTSQTNLLQPNLRGTFPMSLVFSDKIDERSFHTLLIEDFRAHFLLGELIVGEG